MTTNLPVDLLHWSLAIFPMVLLLVLLVFYRWKAAEAGALGVLCTLLTAALAFETSFDDIAVAGAKGAWDSIYILYVIWPAMILYLLGKTSGAFDALGKEIVHFSKNEFFLVLGFGWVFASFFQGISGFGTPVAVAAPILVALGVKPVYAVAMTLIGHAWANMFGTLGVSWIATNQVVSIDDPMTTAFQTAFLLGIVNVAGGLMLAWLYGRWAAVKHGLPMILIIAFIQGGGQVLLSGVNPVLSNFVPGTLALLALYPLSKWQRYRDPIPADLSHRPAMDEDSNLFTAERDAKDAPVMSLAMALFPYILLAAIAIPMLTITPVTNLISAYSFGFPFPAIETGYGVVRAAEEAYSPLRPFNHPGFFLLITSVITWLVFRSKGYFEQWAQKVEVPAFGPELVSAAVPTSMAVVSYLIMSRVLDHSGQTSVLAFGIQTFTPPLVFAFFANGIGIFGAFMTSSNTASNVLFSQLQSSIAELENLPQSSVIAAQSAGGAIGNAIAPANAVLGTSTTGIVGKEGDILRLTLPWTLGIAVITGILTVILVNLA
ncbi:L-lactate permease [Rhodovibrionaceae bacterium A322]